MGCEKCIAAGKQKTIHFERCGRWDTRIYCEHTYKKARLTAHNKEFGERKRIRHVVTEGIKRKPTPYAARRAYTAEMDAFILTNYIPRHKWGAEVNRKMAREFMAKFNIPVTVNALIGRHHRLMQLEEERIEKMPRQVPSLPVLKFMQGS